MLYREHAVEGVVADYVQKLWVLDNSLSALPACDRTVLPNGRFNIALVYGQGARAVTYKACYELEQGVYFCGQMTQAVAVDIYPYTKVILVQLFPWTPAAFGYTSMGRFSDLLTEIRDPSAIFTNFMTEGTLSDEEAVLGLLQNNLQLPVSLSASTQLILKSCRLMLDNGGKVSMQDVLAQVGCSARVLQKRFADAVGLSPKQFMGIVRLRDAVDQIAYPETEGSTLTGLALEHDYYDQAHFTNTFRFITRTTPGKFKPSEYLLSLKK